MKTLNQYLKMTLTVAIVASSLNGVTSQADYTYKYKEVVDGNGYHLKIKEKKTFDLGGYQQVRKVKIKVKGRVPGFSIYADGVARETHYHDDYLQPYYDCDVNGTLSSFSIENGDNDFDLGGVEYEYAETQFNYQIDSPIQDLNQISRDLNVLRNGLNPMEADPVLVPIGVSARRTAAMIYGGGGYTVEASQSVSNLIAQLKAADSILEQCMSIRGLERTAEDLQARIYHLARTFGIQTNTQSSCNPTY